MTDHLGSVRQSRRVAAEPTEDEMTVVLLRQKVKDGHVEEAEAAARDLFAALERVRPDGIRYASTRVVDSSTFVALTELADGIDDPRRAIPEFQRFLEQLKDLVDGPPVIEQLDVVATYNLFGTQRTAAAVQ
jgi:quinol monooxygenase YgiN